MSIRKLERVMWRVRKEWTQNTKPSYACLRKAIMIECGTSYAAYRDNLAALRKLGWIKSYNRKRFRLTDKDLTESY